MDYRNPYAQALLAAGASNAIYLQILVEGLAPSDRRRRRIPLDVAAAVLEQLLHRDQLPSAREIEERLRRGEDAASVTRSVFESVKEAAQRVLDEEVTRHARYVKANNDRITNFLATLVTLRCEKVTMLRERPQPDENALDDYAGLVKASALAQKAIKTIEGGIEEQVAFVEAELKGADVPVRVLARKVAKGFVDEVTKEATAHFVTDRKGAPRQAEVDAFSEKVRRMWADAVRDFSQSCPLPVLKDGTRQEIVLELAIPQQHLPMLSAWTRIKMVLQSIGESSAGKAALVSGVVLAACLWAPGHSYIESFLDHPPVTAKLVEWTLGTICVLTVPWRSWAWLSQDRRRKELATVFATRARRAERQLGDLLLEGHRKAATATLDRAREIATADAEECLSILVQVRDMAARLTFDIERKLNLPSSRVA